MHFHILTSQFSLDGILKFWKKFKKMIEKVKNEKQALSPQIYFDQCKQN